jgi:hypothetical protein
MTSEYSPQGADGAVEEDPAGVEDHRQAQQQRPDVVAQPERRGGGEAEDLAADWGPQQDRDREDGRDQEAVAHVGDHGRHGHGAMAAVAHHLVRRAHRVPRGRGVTGASGMPGVSRGGWGGRTLVGMVRRGRGTGRARVVIRLGRRRFGVDGDRGVVAVAAQRVGLHQRITDVLWHRLAGAVHPTLLDPAAQVGQGGLSRVVGHGGGLGDGIGLDPLHPRPAPQHGLDHRLLRTPQHRVDIQDGGGALLGCHHEAPVAPKRRSRSELATTLTLDNAMAAPAMTGLSNPAAASGIAAVL